MSNPSPSDLCDALWRTAMSAKLKADFVDACMHEKKLILAWLLSQRDHADDSGRGLIEALVVCIEGDDHVHDAADEQGDR